MISEVIWHGFKFGDLATLALLQSTPPFEKIRERERDYFLPIFLRGRVIRAQARQHKPIKNQTS